MGQVIVPLPEIELIPLNKHPAAAFTGGLYIYAPAVYLRILVIPLSAGIVIEVERHIDPVILLQHLAERNLGNFPDEVVAGDFFIRAGFCCMLAEFYRLLGSGAFSGKFPAVPHFFLSQKDVLLVDHCGTTHNLISCCQSF